jgi:hypothetical protein
MQFISQLLHLIQMGFAAILRFISSIWEWTIVQIGNVPWSALGDLSLFQTIILIVAGAITLYGLYKAASELIRAGEKLLAAFVTALSVFVHTLPYILIAGFAAAGGAWMITHVSL